MGQGSDALRRDDDDIRSYDPSSDVNRTADEATVDDDTSTAEIRANIEQTRADMSETIEAIQERLNPQHLTEQVKEQVKEQFEDAKATVREATIGKAEDMVRTAGDTVSEARYTLMEAIRQNPIPAAMIGIGLGWLLMNRRSTPSYSRGRYTGQGGYGSGYYGTEQGYRSYGSGGSYYGGEHERGGIISQGQRAVSDTVGRVQDTAGSVASRAQDTAGQVASRAQETVGNVADRAQETVGGIVTQAQETAESLAYRTQYQAQRLEDRFQQALYETPLAVGAIAFALGTAVGLAAPQTERENELMGEARDTLVERAQDVAQDTVEKLQRVAGQVVEGAQSTATQAAQDQGLSSS